jgi:transcription elongation factor/antiterminator RfaH
MTYLQSPSWYAVYSKPRKEEFATFHLRLKGLDVFFPLLLLPRSGKRRERLVPLFPNYLFVKMRFFEESQYVVWSPGVKRIVSFDGVPAPMDDNIIDLLMARANSEGVMVARSNLKVGQEVQITGGPFEGLIGIIEEPPDAKGRVKVLMHLLSRQVRVEVPVEFVESGWAAY